MSYYVIIYSYGQFSKLTVYSTSLDQGSLFNRRFFFWFLNDQVRFLDDTDQCSSLFSPSFYNMYFFLGRTWHNKIEQSLMGCHFDCRFICC